MQAIRFIVAAAAMAVLSSAHAALVTQTLDVTLWGDSESGLYSKGHVFRITATYDDAGTSFRDWFDGPDGKADFGAGDDTLAYTWNLPYYGSGYTALSDAEISISGLLLPAGYTPRDASSRNSAYYFFSPLHAPGTAYLILSADDLYLFVAWSSSEIVEFGLYQAYTDASGEEGRFVSGLPEPGTMALLGLSIAGLAVSVRRGR